MTRYIAGRLLQALLSILILTTLVFFLVRLTGDPAGILTSDFAPPEVRERIAERLGLDRPLYEQYVSYVASLAVLDLGESFGGGSVLGTLIDRLPETFSLALAALTVAVVLGLPLGILSAVFRGSAIDIFSRSVALFGQSVPSFWFAIMLVLVFAVILGVLPVAYSEGLESYILPATAMGWVAVAGIARLVRSSMLDVLDSDYVRMARAKGLPPRVVIVKHAFRSAMIPVLTYSGLVFAAFLNGSVVVETVFAWPGLGKLIVDAVSARDFPVVQGGVIVIAVFFITINLVVDLLYAYLDPRIRYS